jgi:hypothetical protein
VDCFIPAGAWTRLLRYIIGASPNSDRQPDRSLHPHEHQHLHVHFQFNHHGHSHLQLYPDYHQYPHHHLNSYSHDDSHDDEHPDRNQYPYDHQQPDDHADPDDDRDAHGDFNAACILNIQPVSAVAGESVTFTLSYNVDLVPVNAFFLYQQLASGVYLRRIDQQSRQLGFPLRPTEPDLDPRGPGDRPGGTDPILGRGRLPFRPRLERRSPDHRLQVRCIQYRRYEHRLPIPDPDRNTNALKIHRIFAVRIFRA